MRSLLRKAPFEPKDIDLNELVRETVEFLSALAVGRAVKLGSLIWPTALPIVGDRIQLQQVILNLVVNAIDAMADTPGDDRLISIRTSRAGNFAEMAISDRGPGIPEDKLNEVFEPFFTSKSKGMGMGLSIARTIVEAHDGQISADNEPDGARCSGSSYRFPATLELGSVRFSGAAIDCAVVLACNIGPELIFSSAAPRLPFFDKRDQLSASAIQRARFAGSRWASCLHSVARKSNSD